MRYALGSIGHHEYPTSFIRGCKKTVSDPKTTKITSNGIIGLPYLNWPRPRTTTSQSRFQNRNNYQRPLPKPERAKECWLDQIGFCIQNLLQKLRFLVIWGNGKKTEDAHFETQKGCLSVWPQRQASLRAVSRITFIAWTLVMSKSMPKLDSRKFPKSEYCFLEASLSTKYLNAGNDHMPTPLVYNFLARLVRPFIRIKNAYF